MHAFNELRLSFIGRRFPTCGGFNLRRSVHVNARECLLRGGFSQDRRYEAVLFDPERKIAIRLLERDPRSLLG